MVKEGMRNDTRKDSFSFCHGAPDQQRLITLNADAFKDAAL